MAVRCVSSYRATVSQDGTLVTLVYLPGEVVEDAALSAFLLRDSPGSFEAVEAAAPDPDVRALDAAPVDRMVKPRQTTRRKVSG